MVELVERISINNETSADRGRRKEKRKVFVLIGLPKINSGKKKDINKTVKTIDFI